MKHLATAAPRPTGTAENLIFTHSLTYGLTDRNRVLSALLDVKIDFERFWESPKDSKVV